MPTVVESIAPARWRLMGSVTGNEHLLQISHSLKVIRHKDALYILNDQRYDVKGEKSTKDDWTG